MEEYVAIVVNNKGVSIDPKLQQTDIKMTKGRCHLKNNVPIRIDPSLS